MSATALPVLRMEWIKLRSLRSTRWTLAATVAGTVGVGVAVLGSYTSAHFTAMTPEQRAGFDPTNMGLSGMLVGMLAIGIVGVLTMTGEYSSGLIRMTLATVPNRRLLLAGKALVLGVAALVIGEITTFANFLFGEAVLTGAAPHASLSQPAVLRAVALTGVFLALLALVGLGLGAIIRSTAGAITAYLGGLFVAPMIVPALGGSAIKVAGWLSPMLLVENSVAAVKPVPDAPPVWAAMGILGLYAVLALGAGAWLLNRRDA